MLTEFADAVEERRAAFGVDLDAVQIGRLATFYELVMEHNPILHLVGPCTPDEFAVRHVLESLVLLPFMHRGARLADVGPGAGFPSVPCLIVRDDLGADLIESKEKKSRFLREVLEKCEVGGRAEVVNRQFGELRKPDAGFVTCRALDKFTQKLPQLLKWSEGSTRLFFGGPTLRDALQRQNVVFSEHLIPLSEHRFLFKIA